MRICHIARFNQISTDEVTNAAHVATSLSGDTERALFRRVLCRLGMVFYYYNMTSSPTFYACLE